jgi:hypothetical protein
MAPVRRLVVDVMKPHDPSLVAFTERLAAVDAVEGVTADLVERDTDVQNLIVALEGDGIDLAAVEAAVEELGGAVHSVDQVACGDRTVEPPVIER